MVTPASKPLRLGVVGAGVMGSGIAECAARGGATVVVVDTLPGAMEKAAKVTEASLAKAVANGALKSHNSAEIAQRISWSTVLPDLADCDLVIEAVSERAEAKVEVFTALGDIISAKTLLATNTSSLSITPIAMAIPNPGRVLGLHFFNPVPRMRLVEVIRTHLTSDETVLIATDFVTAVMGKVAVQTSDRPGFIVNALLVPFLMSAARMHSAGIAAIDIDTSLTLGAGHPMGPLKLLDLIGLDTILLIADALYADTCDPANVPPPELRRMVNAGWTGRKSGRGYYEYPP